MADHVKKPAPEPAKPKTGLGNFLGGIMDGLSSGLSSRHPKPTGHPADPATRMTPVRADRAETGAEMIFRATEGERGQAPMVRVDRQREYVARAMAEGALRRLQVDLAVAVTGIAGPGGGTPDKPVGTVWLAVASAARTEARRIVFLGSRREIRERAAQTALHLLGRRLLAD